VAEFPVVGVKHDSEKDPWQLVPWDALREVVKVLGFGAKRYGDANWQHVRPAGDRYFAATIRHLVAWRGGQRLADDSGLPHLALAATSILFLIWFELNKDTGSSESNIGIPPQGGKS
jgi:hypothetical protein